MFLKKFGITELKYVCPVEYRKPEMHSKLLSITNTKQFIGFYKYSMPFIHFWLSFLFYYFGYVARRRETSVIESLIITYIILNYI